GCGIGALPRVSGAGGACRPMDVQAQVLVADERRLAGVQTNPYPDLPVLRPGMLGQHLLHGGSARAGIERALEHDEEGVALGPELMAAVGRQGLALDRVMREQNVRILLAELLDQPCRPLDVAEKERDRAGRLACPAGEAAPTTTG